MAVLVHDPALAEQQVLVKAVVAVAQSALENARLQAAQIAEIKASRARIAEDALDDRRKIERDLHDGVQGRLLWLMHLAEQLRAAAGDNPERPELAGPLKGFTQRSSTPKGSPRPWRNWFSALPYPFVLVCPQIVGRQLFRLPHSS
jgi:hypothetical protein